MEIWDAYLADGTLAGRDLVSEMLVRHTDGDYLLMQRDFCHRNTAKVS